MDLNRQRFVLSVQHTHVSSQLHFDEYDVWGSVNT